MFKAQRLLFHSSFSSRVIQTKERLSGRAHMTEPWYGFGFRLSSFGFTDLVLQVVGRERESESETKVTSPSPYTAPYSGLYRGM